MTVDVIQRLGALLLPIEKARNQTGIRRKAAGACETANGVKRTRILLADDDLPMLAAIGQLLAIDFEVVETVSDGVSLVEAAFKLRPDVIVTDIAMPKMNGLQAIRKIRESLPGIKFIFLTMHAGKAYRKEAQDLGAAGYVLKSSARDELCEAINHASKGLA